MTQPSNLYSTYDAASSVPGGSIREDLMDKIFNVAPMETPVLSKMERTKATNRKHEWLIDTLDAPSATNYHEEGSDFAAAAITAPTRLYNICQISKKEFVLSKTATAVDSVGGSAKAKYQYARKMQALKTDMETQVFANNAAVDSAEATARETGGLPAWFVTNVSRGSGGSSGSLGTTGATDGTQRALTEGMLLSVAQSIWENSNTGSDLMLVANAFNKRIISTIAGNATATIDAASKKRVGTVDVYESDFGIWKIMLDRHIRSREVMFLQPEYIGLAVLRPIQKIEFAADGDNEKHGIVVEYGLEVRNQKALGIVADLTTS